MTQQILLLTAAKDTSRQMGKNQRSDSHLRWRDYLEGLKFYIEDLPDEDALRQLVEGLLANPFLSDFNSQPLKDIVHRPDGLSSQDKLTAAATGTLDDWKKAICGQRYAIRQEKARKYSLPIGLPVEDAFLRAMVVTDALTEDEDMRLIDGGDVWHVYASEKAVSKLIRHQTRIVLGSAINAACFAYLTELPATMRHADLELAAKNEDWLKKVIASQLSRWPWGDVPSLYLYKRVRRISGSQKDLLKPKRLVLLFAGFGFDFIVFVAAQVRMARGVGVGHW